LKGRRAGWHAAALPGRIAVAAQACAGAEYRRLSMLDEVPALEAREVRACAVWGKIVVCTMTSDGDVECRITSRDAAAQLLVDLQLALNAP